MSAPARNQGVVNNEPELRVGARTTKGSVVSGDDDRPDSGILVIGPKCTEEFLYQSAGESVQSLCSVQGNDPDTIFFSCENSRLRHIFFAPEKTLQ